MKSKKCRKTSPKFGFNSYNLLTFAILSFNVVSNLIANVNNNVNNNNNNDNLAALGSIQTSQSSTKSEQTNKNMVMITVPPVGPPIVVPIGRILKDGEPELDSDLTSDRKWKVSIGDESWVVFSNGTLIQNGQAVDGKVLFGRVENSELVDILFEEPKNFHATTRNSGKSLPTEGEIVQVKNYQVRVTDPRIAMRIEAVREDYQLLVLVAMPEDPSKGQEPILIGLGKLLSNGSVVLDQVLPEGAYWQSSYQTLFENGTVIDIETGQSSSWLISYATVTSSGRVHVIDDIDLDGIKALNIGNPTFVQSNRGLGAFMQRFGRESRSIKIKSRLNFAHSMLRIASKYIENESDLINISKLILCTLF